MHKVVLIDDEPSVLEGLRIFADWEKLGFVMAGVASDGASGLKLINDATPALVICDIRMPLINGLELFEKVACKSQPIPKFIMLSGYHDFYYAKKAMSLGALSYLTKPLDAEELQNELQNAAEVIDKEDASRKENLEYLRSAANQAFEEIMAGERSPKLSQKARFLFGKQEAVQIIQLNMRLSPDEEADRDLICESLCETLRIRDKCRVFENGRGNFLAMISPEEDGEAGAPEMDAIILEVKKAAPGCSKCFLLASEATDAGGDFTEAVFKCGRQLEEILAWCMMHPEKAVLDYKEFKNKRFSGEKAIGLIFSLPYERILSALKNGSRMEAMIALDAFFHVLGRNSSLGVNAVCLSRLADLIGRTAYACGIGASREVSRFACLVSSRHAALEECRDFAGSLCSLILDNRCKNSAKPVELLEIEIIEHIKGNCLKNLSLQSIAEAFSMSALIISKIVKKKTGKKYNDFINALRIENAAKLIAANPEMKMAEVGAASGYSDYVYFTVKFKELTGVSPSEYKRKYQL
ncbi:MAG: response regulator [Clostridiales bacterium]|jgi:two-component system response regulator YesN|nr:response regulator [Clostridiales bacterium]